MTTPLWVAALFVAGAAWYLGLAAYVWRHRRVPGGPALMGMLLSVGMWTLCYALELSSRTIPTAQFWSGVKFIGIVGLVPTLWAFVVRYTDAERAVPRAVLAAMAIEPVVVLAILAVPAWAPLLHSYPGGAEQRYAPYPVPEVGPLFWAHAVYTYLLLFSAIWVLCVRLSRITGGYRRAAQAIMVTTVLPLIGNLVFNSGLAGLDTIDPTPFLFTVTVSVLVWGFFRFQLVDLLPVARTAVLERLQDAVIVVDGFDRVLDVNPAGCRLLGAARQDVLGVPLADLVPPLAAVVATASGTAGAGTAGAGAAGVGAAGMRAAGARREPVVVPLPAPWRSTWGEDDAEPPVDLRLIVKGPTGPAPRDVAVTVTPLRRRAPGPRAVVVRDVTSLKRVEHRLRRLLREQTALAQTLQQALRPAALPAVAGVTLAARSLPAGRAEDDGAVSGDFYDVHRAGAHWAFVLGDVSGKGVHAAVVTALTRYTVRTLSAEGHDPTEVVAGLNRALHADGEAASADGPGGDGRGGDGRGGDGERFCTLVYGHLVPRPDGALEVRLALAGHPQPLVRRRDGRVEAVGEPGTVLGLLPEVDVEERLVVLEPGDVLLTYTDGVTEARRAHGPARLSISTEVAAATGALTGAAGGGSRGAAGLPAAAPAEATGDGEGEQFGDSRLAAVLAEAGSEPAEAVAAVLHAVTTYAAERDDIAVLALAPSGRADAARG